MKKCLIDRFQSYVRDFLISLNYIICLRFLAYMNLLKTKGNYKLLKNSKKCKEKKEREKIACR